MAPRGRPRADDEPVLRDVVAAWRKLGGPRRCEFARAVRAVITDEYATKRHYSNAKNLRERIYALKRTPYGTAMLDRLAWDYAAALFDELKKRMNVIDPWAQFAAWRAEDEERFARQTEPWRRLLAFHQAFPDLITRATPVPEAWRLYDEAYKAARKLMRQRNPRRRKSPA